MRKIVTEIPVLDLSRTRASDGSFNEDFVLALRDAAHRVGFFQVTGYSEQPRQAAELLDAVARFFARPLEEKLLLDNRTSPQFRGYTRLGAEVTRGRADWREQIDFGPERPALSKVPEDAPYLNLQGPNQWPAEFPQLKERALAWAELMSRTGRELLAAIGVGLGLDEHYFDEPFAHSPAWMGKLVHYVGGTPEPGAQGVGLHADYGFITLLLQDEVGGLQVKPYGQDHWIDVPPIPGALVVNLGEMLEVATDGYLMATIHRVASPPPGVDRYSVPFFYSPRLDAVIERIELPAELAAAARGLSDDPENPMLSSYGANVLKGWLRAHPETAARHYPQLVKRTDR